MVDDGGAFDPTSYSACPESDDDLLQVGGRGIELVRRTSSLFAYERDGLYNVVTLKINEL